MPTLKLSTTINGDIAFIIDSKFPRTTAIEYRHASP